MSKVNSHIQAMSGMGEVIRTYVEEKLYFSGMRDTPSGYLGHSGDYLVVNDSETSIHFTGIEKIAQDLTDYGFGGNDSESITGFTGLYDTPSNYESGHYLRSTEVGIEYIDITGLAEEVAQEIDFPEGVTGFTGLHDTPSNYELGKYLRSSTEGVTYAGLIPETYNSIEEAPTPPSDYDGEIVRVGCDIMISCDGEWKPLVSTDKLPLSEAEKVFYPGCVTTVGDSISYDNYINATLSENSSLILEASLNGQTVDDVLHKVCTFQNIDGQSNDTSSEGTWQNITTNYNFASCQIQDSYSAFYHSTWSTRYNNNNLKAIGTVCEFNRDGTLLLIGWAEDSGASTFYVDVMSPNFDSQGAIQPGSAPVASLRSNIATLWWGRSASINDIGDVIAVSDIGVTNTDGGHGAVVIYNLNLSTNTVTEKQIIRLPLTNNDYSDDIEDKTMNVSLSGDGKTLVVQFLQSYYATNPKSIFIYNYNESTQMFELHQTINGIGFQNVKMSKDGSTIMIVCGYSLTYGPSYLQDAIGWPDANTKTAYFHGLKILRRDSQNIWSEANNLSIFDLGIKEAVKTGGINWNLPIGHSIGAHLDINREGTAIMYQLPDRLQLTNDNYYLSDTTTQRSVQEHTGPIGVITWDGENWNRLGNLIFDNGNLGFLYQTYTSGTATTSISRGGISDDGTLIMALSRNMYTDNRYRVNMNFLKWTGSAWEKSSNEITGGSNSRVYLLGGCCMSKNPHPTGKTIIGFLGRYRTSTMAYTFTEECSTNLVGGGTISTNSPVSSCGVVRIKDTGYKWGLFPKNTQITVQAFPSPSCDFDGWGGQNIADPNALETTVNVTSDMSITGNFSVK